MTSVKFDAGWNSIRLRDCAKSLKNLSKLKRVYKSSRYVNPFHVSLDIINLNSCNFNDIGSFRDMRRILSLWIRLYSQLRQLFYSTPREAYVAAKFRQFWPPSAACQQGSAKMCATQFSIKQAGRMVGHLAFLSWNYCLHCYILIHQIW